MKKFTTPDLPYAYNALEPFVDEETMRIHHDKHHVAYTTKLNKALEAQPELFEKNAEEILANLDTVNADIRPAVKNHGGGHVHHTLFWQIMRPGTDANKPKGELMSAIESAFGSWDKFRAEFTTAAMTVFGSGWAWLSLAEGKLIIEKTSNQDSPYSLSHQPILGLDVWEHAYYLKYQNRRAESRRHSASERSSTSCPRPGQGRSTAGNADRS